MSELSSYVAFNQDGKRLITLTFGIPKAFYDALGKEQDAPASDPDVMHYLRDVVKQNIEHLIDAHQPKPPRRIKLKRRR